MLGKIAAGKKRERNNYKATVEKKQVCLTEFV